ncbi:MAG: hypothetical protein H0X33_11415 [Taibaiella sp.]|nr:hypothetical protein [Taibaiella sp.]
MDKSPSFASKLVSLWHPILQHTSRHANSSYRPIFQAEIARQLGINRKTLYTWIKQGAWHQMKQSATYMPQMIIDMLYQHLYRMNKKILASDYTPYEETANIMRKLTLCIATLKGRQSASEQLNTFTELLDRVEDKDPVFAQRLQGYMNDYLSEIAGRTVQLPPSVTKELDEDEKTFSNEELSGASDNETEQEQSVTAPAIAPPITLHEAIVGSSWDNKEVRKSIPEITESLSDKGTDPADDPFSYEKYLMACKL